MGTRRRAAAAGREGRPGSRGLPAVTQTLPLHPGPRRQRVAGTDWASLGLASCALAVAEAINSFQTGA